MSLSIVEQTPNYNTAKSFVAYLNYMRDHNATFRNTFGILTKRKTTRQPSPKTLLEFLEK
jgi:hypothetical protein